MYICLRAHMLQLGSKKGGVISSWLQGKADMLLPLPSEIMVILKMCLSLCESVFHYGNSQLHITDQCQLLASW